MSVWDNPPRPHWDDMEPDHERELRERDTGPFFGDYMVSVEPRPEPPPDRSLAHWPAKGIRMQAELRFNSSWGYYLFYTKADGSPFGIGWTLGFEVQQLVRDGEHLPVSLTDETAVKYVSRAFNQQPTP